MSESDRLRPAVDELFFSLAKLRGVPIVATLLTGMGSDGADVGSERPLGAPLPGFLERRRAEQAADVVGAKRRRCSLRHRQTLENA